MDAKLAAIAFVCIIALAEAEWAKDYVSEINKDLFKLKERVKATSQAERRSIEDANNYHIAGTGDTHFIQKRYIELVIAKIMRSYLVAVRDFLNKGSEYVQKKDKEFRLQLDSYGSSVEALIAQAKLRAHLDGKRFTLSTLDETPNKGSYPNGYLLIDSNKRNYEKFFLDVAQAECESQKAAAVRYLKESGTNRDLYKAFVESLNMLIDELLGCWWFWKVPDKVFCHSWAQKRTFSCELKSDEGL